MHRGSITSLLEKQKKKRKKYRIKCECVVLECDLSFQPVKRGFFFNLDVTLYWKQYHANFSD